MEQQTGIFHEFTRKEKDINEEFILNVPVYLCKEEKREIVTLADIHSCIETMFQVLLLNKNEYFTVLAGDYGHRSNMGNLPENYIKRGFIEPELLNNDYYLEEDLTSPNSILLAFCFLAFNKESIIPLRGNHETKDLLEVDLYMHQAAYKEENRLFLDKKGKLMSIENLFNSLPSGAMIKKEGEHAFITHSYSPDQYLLESCFENIQEENGLFIIDKLKDFFKEVKTDGYPDSYFNYLKNNNSGSGRITVSLLCDHKSENNSTLYDGGRIYLPEDLHMENIHSKNNNKKVFCLSGHDNSALSFFKAFEKNKINPILRGDKRCCYRLPVNETNNFFLGKTHKKETRVFLTMNFAYVGEKISGQKVSPFIFPEDIFDKKDLNEELLKIKSILLSSEK